MQESKLKMLKNLNLLLVEDDESLRDNLNDTLSLFFNNIFLASNGLEALEIYSNNSIDVIITDYVMPILDGHKLCKEIRNNNTKIPLVIMSNYTDSEKLLKLIDLELTEYLIKPVEYSKIISTLIKIIEKLERENILFFNINDDIKFDRFNKTIINKKTDEIIKLTKSEILILELMIKNINALVTTEMIEYALSPTESKSEQAIKNLFHRLRTKLSKDTILNVQGVGYILKV